jgi:hypothetical protein
MQGCKTYEQWGRPPAQGDFQTAAIPKQRTLETQALEQNKAPPRTGLASRETFFK